MLPCSMWTLGWLLPWWNDKSGHLTLKLQFFAHRKQPFYNAEFRDSINSARKPGRDSVPELFSARMKVSGTEKHRALELDRDDCTSGSGGHTRTYTSTSFMSQASGGIIITRASALKLYRC